MLTKSRANMLLPVTCELPASLIPWLTYKDSLTDRLMKKAGNAHLEVLAQRWEAADWWDQQVLHIQDKTVLHREIIMWASNEPCWYARTVIPQATYDANDETFDRLKNESLGAIIFNDTKIERISLFHYPINAKSIEYHWLNEVMHQQSKIVWVRMSVFTIGADFPFYLTETMLPGLMRYPN